MRIATDRSRSSATRRNGTLQSCEPCRRSKQRCDHGRPVCRRCATKGINDRCFYHPAPMTRQKTSNNVTSALSTSVTPSRLASQPASSGSSPGSLAGGRLFAPLEPPSALPGYLGATSFAAVLAEHRTEIPYEPEESTDSHPVLSVEPDRVRSGADVLLVLYNMSGRESWAGRFCSESWNCVVPKVIMDAILKSIREIFDAMDSSDLMPQLQDLSMRIFNNSSRPMATYQSMTVEEYCASFTGANFRWEALGNIFSLCGQQLVVTPDNDPEFLHGVHDPRTKDRFIEQMTVASTKCLNFCDQASSVNEILAFLQYNDVMIRLQQYGDSSYQGWRRLGDLIATIYAAGLHLDTDNPPDCPFFLRQWRRHCFASAFYMDKMVASFVGRPPLMNQRYCTLVPPLDLSDDVLVAGGDALDQAMDELDSNGWSTNGVRTRFSHCRLRFQLSVQREKTLDIALGNSEPQDMMQRSYEIQESVRAAWTAAPDHLCYDRQEHEDFHDGWLNVVHLYLNYLYTFYLLHRAQIKHTNTGQDAVCDVSRRILTIVIGMSSMRNPMVDLDRHFSWIALTFGLPTASVLLLELLHQSHSPSSQVFALPRAEIIRNLSVFISLLSWVSRPGHGNYKTCKEAEKKLSRILDQLLDPQPAQAGLFDDVTSNLSSFLNWSSLNSNSWDFTTEYLSMADGIAP